MFSYAWFTTSFIAASCEAGIPASARGLADLLLEPLKRNRRVDQSTSAASMPDSGRPVSANSFAVASPSR